MRSIFQFFVVYIITCRLSCTLQNRQTRRWSSLFGRIRSRPSRVYSATPLTSRGKIFYSYEPATNVRAREKKNAATECVRVYRSVQAFLDGTNLSHTFAIVTLNELLRSNHLPRGTTTKVIVYELPPIYRDGWMALYGIAGIRELSSSSPKCRTSFRRRRRQSE